MCGQTWIEGQVESNFLKQISFSACVCVCVANGRAFIVKIANPFDFIDMGYQQQLEKYMPLCLALNSVGFHTKIIVLIIGSLGVVHRKFISGLHILGLTQRQGRSLARYLSLSVMSGSRRVWERIWRFRTGAAPV